jgi:uncharacterized protein YqeY
MNQLKIKQMIKEQINKDYMTAFKAKNTVKKNLLSVVKGEIQTQEKNTGVENMSDEDVLKILTKTAKSLNETIKSLSPVDGKGEDLVQACAELAIVQCYLPKQMSKDEVTQKVTEIVNSGITNIGAIMKEFASLPADKKMVSEAIKEIVK